MTLSAFLFHTKEMILIAGVVLTTVFYNNNIWTQAALVTISINCIAVVGNMLAEKYVVD